MKLAAYILTNFQMEVMAQEPIGS